MTGRSRRPGWATGAGPIRGLTVTLLVIGVLAVVLGIWYWRTAVEYRRTAEQAVRMRAGIFAMQFASQLQTQLHAGVEAHLGAEFGAAAPDALARLTRTADSLAACICATRLFAIRFFHVPAGVGETFLSGQPLPTSAAGVRFEAVRARMRDAAVPLNDPVVLGGRDERGPWLLAFRTAIRETDTVGVGFEMSLDSLRTGWGRFVRTLQVPATPPDSVTGVISLVVRAGDSTELARFGPERSGHGAQAVSGWTGLPIDVTVDPAAEALLVPGGVPQLPVASLVLVGLVGFIIMATGLGLNRRAEALAAARAEFTAGVTHELRTPLTQILLFAETLALDREPTSEGRTAAARAIVRESRRLLQLVENVLRFATSARSAAASAPRPQPLAPLVTDIVRLAGPLAAVDGARIELVLRATPDAVVDAPAIRQILGNLIDNAIRYGPAGQTVRVTVDREAETAVVTVEDQGPGISPADRDRIFEPYVRLGAEDRHSAGVGLGLPVVRDLAAALGGTVRVEERPGPGAVFVLRVPALPEEEPPR